MNNVWKKHSNYTLFNTNKFTNSGTGGIHAGSSNGINNNSINNNNNNNMCSNCGKYGHYSYQCNYPTVSYGMIVYRIHPISGIRQYLMICRKDSFGYVDFIRGKYSLTDIDHVRHIFREMSAAEHNKIRNATTFNQLWCDLWNINCSKTSHKHEERISRKKYETLQFQNLMPSGKNDDIMIPTLTSILDNSTCFPEPEWEFPKGRKEFNESETECALREFAEETGIPLNSVQVVENLVGFDENYIGTNYMAYKHRYFLAEYIGPNEKPVEKNEYEGEYKDEGKDESKRGAKENKLNILSSPFTHFQKSEVSKLEWKSLAECLECIRPYHLEKKKLLQNIDFMLDHYCIG